MDRVTLGYLIQFAGVVALICAMLWSGNLEKALIVFGAGAVVVGGWWRKPKRSV